jgi:hypothetical protein
MESDAAVFDGQIVAVEIRRAVIGGYQKIQVAIAVKIGVGQAAADFGAGEVSTQCDGDVVESSVAIIQEKLRRLGIADVAANVANSIVDVPVGNRKIEIAVEVGVEKRAAEAQGVF